jgi:hypothetical protein
MLISAGGTEILGIVRLIGLLLKGSMTDAVAAVLGGTCVVPSLYAHQKWKEALSVVPLKWIEPALWTAASAFFLFLTVLAAIHSHN